MVGHVQDVHQRGAGLEWPGIGVIADARTESWADAVMPQIYRNVYRRPTWPSFFADKSIPEPSPNRCPSRSSPSIPNFPSSTGIHLGALRDDGGAELQTSRDSRAISPWFAKLGCSSLPRNRSD